jgi:hypothetical protein
MDNYSAEQHMIAQQVKANGAAVAQLTMRQFDSEPIFDVEDDEDASIVFDEKDSFHNVFAKQKQPEKPESSKPKRPPPKKAPREEHREKEKGDKTEKLPSQAMPKMLFPKFDGTDPKIWRDNCQSYFDLYKLPEGMWITAAHLHFEGNAAKWYQIYKQTHTFQNWNHFCAVVEEEFGADDLRSTMNELLDLKQSRTVEDYTTQFQALQFTITMQNPSYDEMFFTPQYIRGLKEEIRGTVEPQMPTSVHKASIIAKIQQGMIERNKARYHINANPAGNICNPELRTSRPHQLATYGKIDNCEITERLMV